MVDGNKLCRCEFSKDRMFGPLIFPQVCLATSVEQEYLCAFSTVVLAGRNYKPREEGKNQCKTKLTRNIQD